MNIRNASFFCAPGTLSLILPVLLFITSNLPALAAEPAPLLPREGICMNNLYAGTIGGDLNIRLFLARQGEELKGFYYYEKNGKFDPATNRIEYPHLQLQGKVEGNGQFMLMEGDPGKAGDKRLGHFSGAFDAQGQATGTWETPTGDHKISFHVNPTDSLEQGRNPHYRLRCAPAVDGGEQVQLLIEGEKPISLDGNEGLSLAAKEAIFDPATLSVRLLQGQPDIYWIRYEHRRTWEPGVASIVHRHDLLVRKGDTVKSVLDQWTQPSYEFSRADVYWDRANDTVFRYQDSILSVTETQIMDEVWDSRPMSLEAACKEECGCTSDSSEQPCQDKGCYQHCARKFLAADNSEYVFHKTIRTIDVVTGKTIAQKAFWEKEFYPLRYKFYGGQDQARLSFLVVDDGVSGWLFVRDKTAPEAGSAAPNLAQASFDPENPGAIPAIATCWLYNRIPWEQANATRSYPPAPPEQTRPDHFRPTGCCVVVTSTNGKITALYERTEGGSEALRLLALYETGATTCYSQNLAQDALPWGKAAPDKALAGAAAPPEHGTSSSEQIITTGSGVHLRPDPDLHSPPITRLSIGTVLKKVYLHPEPSSVSSEAREIWYMVMGPGEKYGWVSGEQTEPFDADNPWAAYKTIVERRLEISSPRTRPEDVDFLMFLARILPQQPMKNVERIKESLRRLEKRLCQGGDATKLDPEPILKTLASLDQEAASTHSSTAEEVRNALGEIESSIRQCYGIDNWNLMKEEHLGELRLSLPEQEIPKILSCRPKRGPEQQSWVDGAYHQVWSYPDCGVVLDMVSERKGGPKSIDGIEVTSPSKLKTLRGIGIGSSEKEAVEAYRRYQNLDTYISEREKKNKERKKGDDLVAGSVYGGLFFSFKNGRVSRIFIGAIAE